MKTLFYLIASVLLISVFASIVIFVFKGGMDIIDVLFKLTELVFFSLLAYLFYRLGNYYEKKEKAE